MGCGAGHHIRAGQAETVPGEGHRVLCGYGRPRNRTHDATSPRMQAHRQQPYAHQYETESCTQRHAGRQPFDQAAKQRSVEAPIGLQSILSDRRESKYESGAGCHPSESTPAARAGHQRDAEQGETDGHAVGHRLEQRMHLGQGFVSSQPRRHDGEPQDRDRNSRSGLCRPCHTPGSLGLPRQPLHFRVRRIQRFHCHAHDRSIDDGRADVSVVLQPADRVISPQTCLPPMAHRKRPSRRQMALSWR